MCSIIYIANRREKNPMKLQRTNRSKHWPQTWFIKYVACAQDVGKARPSDAHRCSGRWHCGAPWAPWAPWAQLSPAEPREPGWAPWAPLRPGRRPAPSTRAGLGQGSLPWPRPCALRHRAPAGPQPPWPTEPSFTPQGRSGKSAAPLLDGMRYAPPGCIGALSAERAVASTGKRAETSHWWFCTARSVGYGFRALCRLLAQTRAPTM